MARKSSRILATAVALALLGWLALGAGTIGARADSTGTISVPNKPITTQSVGLQMFMWPWVSLATECTGTLGPEGIDWILVSPPQEDVQGAQWWTHYQPVSYKLDSQLGTEAQFATMVSACNQAGVQVIVDAVINHMAARGGSGFTGTTFSKYTYPGLYGETDFHAGLPASDPNFCDHDITNYNDAFQLVHCELGGLADLATEKPSVQATIAGYLNHLLDLGVAGFRIDAAKHVGVADLAAIRSLLKPVNGQPPYFLSEAVGSAVDNQPFTALGDVFAWDYQGTLTHMFNGQINLAALPTTAAQIGAAANTVIMVSNHDTEHHGPTAITYNDPKKYLAASAYLLASGLGKPMLYTGYAFDSFTPDLGPAVITGSSAIAPAVCPSGSAASQPQAKYKNRTFVCLERWTGIKGMIQWHHQVADAPTSNFVDSKNLLAFTRGSGFFALNGNQPFLKRTITSTVQTGLPSGTYCDVISGGAKAVRGSKCAGTKVLVAADGRAKLALPAMTAIALDSSNKLK